MSVPRAALLIGINDYHQFSESAGMSRTSSDLTGSLNDVIAWFAIARALGIENIRILTSPQLSADALPFSADGVTFGTATGAEITAGMSWLADAMAGDQPGQGLLTCSAHGARSDRGSLLCPADLTLGADGELVGALAWEDLSALLERRAPRSSLTAFLDTCHAADKRTGVLSKRRRVQRSMGGEGRLDRRHLRLQDRTFSSCRPCQSCDEALFSGKRRGVFSWAVTTLLSRTTLAKSGPYRFAEISNRELLEKTQAMTDLLEFSQQAVLEMPAILAPLPVFRPLTPAQRTEIGKLDDPGREIFPDDIDNLTGEPPRSYYLIKELNGGTTLGHLLVTSYGDITLNGDTWPANREYWHWHEGQEWTTQGWRLKTMSSYPGNLTPATAQQRNSAPFPTVASTFSVDNKSPWWSIRYSSQTGDPPVGWLQVHDTHNKWFQFEQQGTVPEWLQIPTQGSAMYFQYEPNGPGSQLHNVSKVDSHQP